MATEITVENLIVASIFGNQVQFNPANGESMRFETVPHIGNTLTFSGTGNVRQ